MLCKCGKSVEAVYESTGKCENCNVDIACHMVNIYKEDPNIEDLDEENVLELPISEIGLSSRTQTLLLTVGVNYVEELIKWTEGRLMRIRNFGEKSLDEIKRGLNMLGLALSQ